jgi:3-oxoacyl-[acyl-carrier-protein] synthase III
VTLNRYSRIAGTGSFLPPNRVTNDALVAQLARDGIESSDRWIVERTGIHARHFADPDVGCSDLAVAAARRALEAADCDVASSSRSSACTAALPSTCRRSAPASSMR